MVEAEAESSTTFLFVAEDVAVEVKVELDGTLASASMLMLLFRSWPPGILIPMIGGANPDPEAPIPSTGTRPALPPSPEPDPETCT